MNLNWDRIRIYFVADRHPLKGNHYIFHSVLLNTRWCETYQLIWHGPDHSRWSFKTTNYKTFKTFIITITNIILYWGYRTGRTISRPWIPSLKGHNVSQKLHFHCGYLLLKRLYSRCLRTTGFLLPHRRSL